MRRKETNPASDQFLRCSPLSGTQRFTELDGEEMGEKRDRGHLVEKKESPKEERDLQAINAGEGVEKRETSYTVGGNVNCYSHNGKQV